MTAASWCLSASRRGPAMLCLVLAFAGTPAVADLKRSVREAEGAVQKAAEAGAQIARRRGSPEYAEAWQEEAGEGIEATATVAIATARGRIERGKNLGQARDFEEAFRLATEARKDLEALAGRLDQLRARQAVRDLLIRGELRRAEFSRAKEKSAVEKSAAEKAAAAEKATADRLAAEQVRATELAREQEAARKEAESRDHAEVQHLVQEISRVAANARNVLDRIAAVQPRSTELDRLQARLEGVLRASQSPPAASAGALQKLHDDLVAATSGLEKVAAADSRQPGPPSELRAAARALFRANYEEVVHSLAGVTFAERRATVTAALLLAAARYSLYLQGGEKDLQLRRKAGENARTCRRLAPTLSPDPKLFSPRFVQFFRSAG